MKREVPLHRAYRLLNNGCTVLVTSSYKDRVNVMALAWQTPVSSTPPLVAIAVAQGHLTNDLIRKSEEFALNIPSRQLLEKVHRCGRVSGRTVDKFQLTGLTPVDAKKVRAPLIEECIGHLECGVIEARPVGDHTLFIAEILAAAAEEGLFTDAWAGEELARTVHHLGGDYYQVGGERVEVKLK